MSTSSKPTRRTAILLFAGIAVLVFVFDQLTKVWAENTLAGSDEIVVIDGFLSWRHHLNTGAAFSMGTEYTWVFTTIQFVVLCVVIWISHKLGGSWLWTLGLAGLAGGVAGNLYDRLFRPPSLVEGSFEQFGQGAVVDFIAVEHFAVFNVADSFIVCSIIGICALMVFGPTINGERPSTATADSEVTEDNQDTTEDSEKT